MNSLSKWLKSTSLNLKNSSFSLWVTGISVIGLVACQAPFQHSLQYASSGGYQA